MLANEDRHQPPPKGDFAPLLVSIPRPPRLRLMCCPLLDNSSAANNAAQTSKTVAAVSKKSGACVEVFVGRYSRMQQNWRDAPPPAPRSQNFRYMDLWSGHTADRILMVVRDVRDAQTPCVVITDIRTLSVLSPVPQNGTDPYI